MELPGNCAFQACFLHLGLQRVKKNPKELLDIMLCEVVQGLPAKALGQLRRPHRLVTELQVEEDSL